MDERQIGLAITLKELGVSSDISGFDSRLILQKAVYLAEEAGINLGYPFNWYLRGPYSPALTRDLFGNVPDVNDFANWVLDEGSLAIAARIKSLVDGPANEEPSAKARRLELLASLRYLSRRRGIDVEDAEAAKVSLERSGKVFTLDEVAAAIDELRRARLL